MRPRAIRRAAALGGLALTLLLAGCGQKGPLYLPAKKSKVPSTSAPTTPPSESPASQTGAH